MEVKRGLQLPFAAIRVSVNALSLHEVPVFYAYPDDIGMDSSRYRYRVRVAIPGIIVDKSHYSP
jgi:hypothetical protein